MHKKNNIARPKPITKRQAQSITDRHIFQREFAPAYDQVLRRFSSSQDGLQNGSPPPVVS